MKKNWKRLTAGMYTAFGGGSVMVWGCISCDGPITTVEGRINGRDYIRLSSRHYLHAVNGI